MANPGTTRAGAFAPAQVSVIPTWVLQLDAGGEIQNEPTVTGNELSPAERTTFPITAEVMELPDLHVTVVTDVVGGGGHIVVPVLVDALNGES